MANMYNTSVRQAANGNVGPRNPSLRAPSLVSQHAGVCGWGSFARHILPLVSGTGVHSQALPSPTYKEVAMMEVRCQHCLDVQGHIHGCGTMWVVCAKCAKNPCAHVWTPTGDFDHEHEEEAKSTHIPLEECKACGKCRQSLEREDCNCVPEVREYDIESKMGGKS